MIYQPSLIIRCVECAYEFADGEVPEAGQRCYECKIVADSRCDCDEESCCDKCRKPRGNHAPLACLLTANY